MANAYFKFLANALKIVLVGDAEVGKSWLLMRSRELYGRFLVEGGPRFDKRPFEPAETYSPTNFETFYTNVESPELGNYQTKLWDTGGRAIFDVVRPLAYDGADVFMLCFDVTSRRSFHNITKRWLPEIQKYRPNTPVVIVGTKSDLRGENGSSDLNKAIPLSEAQSVARKMNTLYHETSAVTGDHVDKAFESAVQLGHTARKEAAVRRRSNLNDPCFDLSCVPSASAPPAIKINPSTYERDFKKILEDTTYTDVTFNFEDGSPCIAAHKIVLCLSPSAFRSVFQNTSSAERFAESFAIMESPNHPPCDQRCDIKTLHKNTTLIILKSWISRQTFMKILEFLYTGNPGISEDSDENDIKDLGITAEKLDMDSLVENCSNFLQVKNGSAEKLKAANPGTRELPESVHSVQGPFLNQLGSLFSDVTFLVDSTLVFAHKVILAARSPFLAALLGEDFIDGKGSEISLHGVDCAGFLAVLEYLYTDHCRSLAQTPVEDVLITADRLCLSRLVQMCENHICDELQRMAQTQQCRGRMESSVDMFAFSKIFNAQQLADWCLHFMATNHTAFEASTVRDEYESVASQNEAFFEEHRWPPQSCLTALDDYKNRIKGVNSARQTMHRKRRGCSPYKCSVM